MALTIKYNPDDRYISAHGDLVFVLYEDTKPWNSTAYPDYKYVCDIYIVTGATETKVARLKSYPRPNDKLGIFDIGSIVRSYLNTEFIPGPPDYFHTQKFNEGEFYVNVICRFGEEYNFTTYPNLVVDSQRAYFNHYNDRLAGVDTILDTYLDKVLSARPYATNIDRNAKRCFIPFLTSDDSSYDVIVKTYNSLGLIQQYTFTLTPTALSIDEVQQFNMSPLAINSNWIGSGNLINDYVDYYTVTFSTPNISDDSTIRFNITCERKYEVKTLHFLNKFGAFESKEFTKVSRKTIETEKSEYGKPAYIVNSDGSVKWFNSTSRVYNERTSVYASEWTDKMQVNTDILTDEEYRWLKQLVVSPLVYCEIDGYMYQTKITETNYEERKIINDRLTNLTLNLEFGERFNAQYR